MKKALFLAVLALASTVISFGFISFRMASVSEEAGMVTFGEPFYMVETGPFYAGYVGGRAREGSLDYIFSSHGAFDDPSLNIISVIGNIIFYFIFFLILHKLIGMSFKTLRTIFVKTNAIKSR